MFINDNLRFALPSTELVNSSIISINSSIFGTSKFFKEQISKSNEDIYSDIEKAIGENDKIDE